MKRYRDELITDNDRNQVPRSIEAVASRTDANAAAATARSSLRAKVDAAVEAARSTLDVPSIRAVLQSVVAALDASDSSSSALPGVPEGMAEEQPGQQQVGMEHVEQIGSECREDHSEQSMASEQSEQ